MCRAFRSVQSARVRRRRIAGAARLIHAPIWTGLDDTGRIAAAQKPLIAFAFWTAWTTWTVLSFFRKRKINRTRVASACAVRIVAPPGRPRTAVTNNDATGARGERRNWGRNQFDCVQCACTIRLPFQIAESSQKDNRLLDPINQLAPRSSLLPRASGDGWVSSFSRCLHFHLPLEGGGRERKRAGGGESNRAAAPRLTVAHPTPRTFGARPSPSRGG